MKRRRESPIQDLGYTHFHEFSDLPDLKNLHWWDMCCFDIRNSSWQWVYGFQTQPRLLACTGEHSLDSWTLHLLNSYYTTFREGSASWKSML